MQDSSALTILRSAMASPGQNLARLLGGDKGGLLRAGTNGIWVCPGHKNVLHVCRGSLIGGCVFVRGCLIGGWVFVSGCLIGGWVGVCKGLSHWRVCVCKGLY